MKFFVALTFLALATGSYGVANNFFQLPEEVQEGILLIVDSCMDTEVSGVTEDDIYKLQMANFNSPSQAMKNLAFCMFKQFGTIDATGNLVSTVVYDRLTPIIGATNTANIVETCSNQSGATYADKAFEIYKCFMLNGSGMSR